MSAYLTQRSFCYKEPVKTMSGSHTESLFLESLGSFLSGFADRPAVWFCLKRLNDNVPCLPGLFNLKYEEMLGMFVCSGLWDPSLNHLKTNKLKFFISSQSLEKVVEHTRIGIRNRHGATEQHHALCIGNRIMGILNKPGQAPLAAVKRMPNLGNLQRVMKEKIFTILKKSLMETGGKQLCENSPILQSFRKYSSSTNNETEEGVMEKEKTWNEQERNEESEMNELDPSHPDNLFFFRINTKLLPLLKEGAEREKVEQVLFELVKEIQHVKEKRVSSIVKSQQIQVSPNSKESPKQFPVMKQYGIPLEEVRVHEALIKELYQLNKKYFNTTSMFVDLGDNKKSTFMMIPQSVGYERLKINESKHQWFSRLMTALGGEGREAASARDLFVHVSTQEAFRDELLVGVRQAGISNFPQFDAIATFAMQSAANLNESQLTILRQCCKAECGEYLFSSPYKIHRVLDLEHIVPVTGTYKVGTEYIPWMYKSVIEIVCLFLKTLLVESKGNKIAKQVDISVCVDHGKGHSRATMLVIVRFAEANVNDRSLWSKQQQSFSVGSARCKRHSALFYDTQN